MVDITTLTLSFSLGLTASFYPCLFPVLPSFVAYTVDAHDKWWKGATSSLLVTLGIMVVFIAMGLIFTSFLDLLVPRYREFALIQGVVLLLLGSLMIIGSSVKLHVFEAVNAQANSILDKIENAWLMSFLIGLFFAALAAPCAIIVFLTIFTIAASESVIGIIVLMIVFSIGAGIPFFLLGSLVPLLKESMMQGRDFNFQKIRRWIPRVTGVLVIFAGMILIHDSKFFII